MKAPQSGIFALGTGSHAYLEFDLLDEAKGRELVGAIAGLREPRTTIGGVNLVVGFRPELWNAVAREKAPQNVKGFTEAIVGKDSFTMPATQHDAVLWLSGSAYDVVFDVARDAIHAMKQLACVAEETSSWAYRNYRDLTGFIDGSENPSLMDAPEVALIGEGTGEGGTVLLLQKWKHETGAWEALSEERQEQVMGRKKSDSEELEDKPADSHVAMTDQDDFGKIFRRNMPYGNVTDHGTMFVGFSAEQSRMQRMLESMAGLVNGKRDALTFFTRPITGAYYFVPSNSSLQMEAAGDGQLEGAKE